MTRILAAVDLSTDSLRVVDAAADYAKRLNAELTIIHVTGDIGESELPVVPPAPEVGIVAAAQPDRVEIAAEIREAHREVQSLGNRARATGITAEALLIQGPPSEKIAQQVEKLEPEFLVMAAHESSFLRDLLFGSVSEQLIGKVACPIMLLPVAKD